MAARLASDGEALSSTIAQAGMRRVMLEAVACGLARGPGDIKAYIQCTLLSALNDFQDVVAKGATGALRWLDRGTNASASSSLPSARLSSATAVIIAPTLGWPGPSAAAVDPSACATIGRARRAPSARRSASATHHAARAAGRLRGP